MRYPFALPRPPRLSDCQEKLRAIEESNWFTNYGPVNTKFENELAAWFDSSGAEFGHCMTVCNATIGLMLAIRYVLDFEFESRSKNAKDFPRYALMPSFTFAATAQAAIWNGLTPLFCDIDIKTWLPCKKSQLEILEKFEDRIAVIVPYATFGNNLDLYWYEEIKRKLKIPVVIDAAASLGSREKDGRHFGVSSSMPVVYSMHATKSFATSEGGVIYCSNKDAIKKMRSMGNFGFDHNRVVQMAGLNSKISEVGALLALEKLHNFDLVLEKRELVAGYYQKYLSKFGAQFQVLTGAKHAFQFMPVFFPSLTLEKRNSLIGQLYSKGIELKTYFSPTLHQQEYFRKEEQPALAVTEALSNSIMSFPIYDSMVEQDVAEIANALEQLL